MEAPIQYEVISAILNANLTSEGKDAYLKTVIRDNQENDQVSSSEEEEE